MSVIQICDDCTNSRAKVIQHAPPMCGKDDAQDIVDELAYRNYFWNRQQLGMDAALYARHSTQGVAFERRYLTEIMERGL